MAPGPRDEDLPDGMLPSLTCLNCGRSVGSDDTFCQHCGARVPSPTAHTVPTGPGAGGPPDSPWELVLSQLREATRGRYRIERELGHGGFAAVYLAHEVALDRKVAMKVMSPAVLMQPGMVERFRLEAVTIAGLKHPNIVTVHGVEHHDQLHFFVLEFVEGRSLENIVKLYGALPVAVTRAWLAQVAGALDYAHGKGVVHRDVKPANILIDTDGNAVVTDFGIAKVEERPAHTLTGMVLGTPSYMSPEQCQGERVAGASDQYSLGVVAYEMLTSRPPFSGPTLTVMQAHTLEPPQPLAEARPDCPPALAQAVMRMLEKDPAARWPRLAEALAAFGGAAPGPADPVRVQLAAMSRGEDATVAASPTPLTPMPQRATPVRDEIVTSTSTGLRRRPATLVLGGAVVVFAIAAAILAPQALRQSPPTASVAALRLTPSHADLATGETVALTAVAVDALDRVVQAPVQWISSDTVVASVAGGVVTARAAGSAEISAASAGRATVARVTVREPAPVAVIEMAPTSLRLGVGETGAVVATVRDSANRILPDRALRWQSGDASVASVTERGIVTALRPGTTAIIATLAGREARASVQVIRVAAPVSAVRVSPSTLRLILGETRSLAVVAVDADGNQLGARSVQWHSSDPATASVASDGVVTGQREGTVTITVTIDGVSSQAAVSVAPEPVVSVTVTPPRVELEIGEQVTLSAAAAGANRRPLPGRPITWESSAPAVARVSDRGIVVAEEAGTASITATSGAGTAAATVVVNEPPARVPSIDAATATALIDQTVESFVIELRNGLESRDIDAVRVAYGVALPAADRDYWEPVLTNKDLRDFRLELTRKFQPEQVGGGWRADFDLSFRLRHSRGIQETVISFRAEFTPDGDQLRLSSLRMRAQR